MLPTSIYAFSGAGNFGKVKMAKQFEAIFGDLPKSDITKAKNLAANLPMCYMKDSLQLPNKHSLIEIEQYYNSPEGQYLIGSMDRGLYRQMRIIYWLTLMLLKR